ncbi:MAG: cyclase family protein [Amphiplicatus sp.]
MTDGRSFCLSLPLDIPGGVRAGRYPPRLFPLPASDDRVCNINRRIADVYPNAEGYVSDDAVELCLQYSTQWDGLSHHGGTFDVDGDGVDEIVYYNGWRAGRDILSPVEAAAAGVEHSGALRLGIDTFAEKAIQTRGVMVDFLDYFGPERRKISWPAFERMLTEREIIVAPGDILCLHSGVSEAVLDMAGKPDVAVLRGLGAELDGADEGILNWISESGVSAIAADNFAVEWWQKPPSTEHPYNLLPLHEHCLFKLGVPLGELWRLTPLAEALRNREPYFLLTAPPLRLPRAVGSPVTPVATI